MRKGGLSAWVRWEGVKHPLWWEGVRSVFMKKSRVVENKDSTCAKFERGFSFAEGEKTLVTREEIIEALNHDLLSFRYTTKEVRDDKEIVLAVVSQFGHLLEYASERLRNDREVVCSALKSRAQSLRYASDELKDDEELVMLAIEGAAEALICASARLKNKESVVRAAIEKDGFAIEYANKRFVDNKEMAMLAVKNKPGVLDLLSEKLRNDLEVVYAAMSSGGGSVILRNANSKLYMKVLEVAVSKNQKQAVAEIVLDLLLEQKANEEKNVLKEVIEKQECPACVLGGALGTSAKDVGGKRIVETKKKRFI